MGRSGRIQTQPKRVCGIEQRKIINQITTLSQYLQYDESRGIDRHRTFWMMLDNHPEVGWWPL